MSCHYYILFANHLFIVFLKVPISDWQTMASFGPEIGADDLDSMSIYTAIFPAEYGHKIGGSVKVNTARDTRD
jgi:hypothetical protein